MSGNVKLVVFARVMQIVNYFNDGNDHDGTVPDVVFSLEDNSLGINMTYDGERFIKHRVSFLEIEQVVDIGVICNRLYEVAQQLRG